MCKDMCVCTYKDFQSSRPHRLVMYVCVCVCMYYLCKYVCMRSVCMYLQEYYSSRPRRWGLRAWICGICVHICVFETCGYARVSVFVCGTGARVCVRNMCVCNACVYLCLHVSGQAIVFFGARGTCNYQYSSRTYVHVYIRVSIHTYENAARSSGKIATLRICIHSYIHTLIIYTQTYTYIYTYMHTYIRTYIHTLKRCMLRWEGGDAVYIFMRSYLHTYIPHGHAYIHS